MKNPTDKYGSFEEKGYQFTAYLPSDDDERYAWYIVVEKDSETIREEYVDLDFPCLFGPDAGDIHRLEDFVDQLIGELEGDAD